MLSWMSQNSTTFHVFSLCRMRWRVNDCPYLSFSPSMTIYKQLGGNQLMKYEEQYKVICR